MVWEKLIGNEEERAVSPVIGVILMVAITVILAAVIAAFVLDLGDSTSANAQASFTVEQDSGTVTISLNNANRLDGVSLAGDCDAEFDSTNWGSSSSPSVGSSSEISNQGGTGTDDCSADDELNIVGHYEGSENVIQSFTFDNDL